MKRRYLYGNDKADVTPANGVKGVLIRDIDGEMIFRVYHGKTEFTDYEIRHDDLVVSIVKDELAAFYAVSGRCILDHSPEVLGLKEVNY